jgi:ketosteroid isomerase-like protein
MMKRIFLAVISLLVLSVVGHAAAQKGPSACGEAWVKAAKANDLDGIVALYAPDAVLYPPDAKVAIGTDAIRQNYAGLLNNFTIQDVTFTDTWHEDKGDTSLEWGFFSLTLVPKAGGDTVHFEGRFTDISKKINGKWLYVVDHASVPTPPMPPPPTK